MKENIEYAFFIKIIQQKTLISTSLQDLEERKIVLMA